MREVAFLPDGSPAPAARVIADEDAYALLVEIVSGLRSPLVGETEVQAQFKAFLASLDANGHAPLLKLGQRVLADAKTIRRQHLQGFGAHSYGSLAARHVPGGDLVVLVGTGALAAEAAAALGGHTLDRWGRRAVDNIERYRRLADAHHDGAISTAPATLVIAAPASEADLAALQQIYAGIATVVDLRAADERTPFDDRLHVITLEDLFREAQAASAIPIARLGAARRDIVRLGQVYGQREELHPFGWDDLCA